MTTVLVVEDDPDVALVLSALFRRSGWNTVHADDGRSALRMLHETKPDVMVLDVGLPGLNGWQVLERVRDMSDLPVLMLTAHGHESERVRGLRAGADDYLTKPFSNPELVARIEALLRRVPAHAAAPRTYDDGVLTLDAVTRQARWRERPLELSDLQFRLLHVLVQHKSTVVTPEQLLARVWDDTSGGSGDRVKFAVLRLRRAIQELDPDADPIESVRGVGYRYRTH
ncbi:response regulator transcription factor [Streptomyces sp. NBC_01465]|uniref:response regulator transcription factor n=1 Tax=Streptomyces sp. NBC_01465 TaxID=2903878 RepID=UPI002E3416A9|nr:response regulator transcription factor [Streptomyces sp. NBC_01465]